MKKIPEIMVDLDDRKDTPAEIRKRFWWLAQIFFPGVKWRTYCCPSPSLRGWHFWAYVLNEGWPGVNYSLDTRGKGIIFFQLLMGSDVGRERANLERVLAGQENWNRLFCTRRVGLNSSLHNAEKRKCKKVKK